MKIKKIILILVMMLCLVGCTNIAHLNYDDIINNFNLKEKNANTYRKGYKYYVPNGLKVDDAGSNYAILTSEEVTYYFYVDFISYINNKDIKHEIDSNAIYSKKINNGKKNGYIEINLWKNNQYLIEIMYNYAKIEVMVEENLINKALINSISILNSIEYNNSAIERLLLNNELDYTEEAFEMFKNKNSNSGYLQYEKEDTSYEEEVEDTDFIN